MINIVGDSSTGKTLLAEEACANYAIKHPGAPIRYIEAESRFDRAYAHKLGLPMDRIELIEDIETVEGVFRQIDEWSKTATSPSLVCVDSWDSLSDEAEQSRKIEEGTYGQNKAKKTSELFRRLMRRIKAGQITLVIVSQVRMNMDRAFGNPWSRAGGKALDFYATQIIWLYHKKRLKRTRRGVEMVYGIQVEAKNSKNSVGRPFRTCQFPLLFEFGIDDVQANLDWLKTTLGEAQIEKALGETYSKLKNRLANMDTKTWRMWQRKTARLVRRRWQQIEEDFSPGRTKYDG